MDGATASRLVGFEIGRAAFSWRPILEGEIPVAELARLTGRDRDGIVG